MSSKEQSDSDITPKLTDNPVIPDDWSWAAWCHNPVTKFVVAAMEAMISDNRLRWEQMSWDNGQSTDPRQLKQLLVKLTAEAQGLSVLKNSRKEEYVKYLDAR